jgi:hypothetical protein
MTYSAFQEKNAPAPRSAASFSTPRAAQAARPLADLRPPSGASEILSDYNTRQARVLQGYFTINPADLAAEKHAEVTVSDMRQTRYGSAYIRKDYRTTEKGANPDSTLTTTEKVSGAQQAAPNSALPGFHVSQNGELAIAAEGQARNFYGSADTVGQANQILARGGARARLKSEGHGISVPANPAQPATSPKRALKKIHAATEQTLPSGQVQNQIAQTLPAMDCNNFIRLVTGAAANASRVAVLENRNVPGGPETEISAEETREPISSIARHITSGRAPNPTTLANRLRTVNLSGQDKEQGQVAYEQLGAPAAGARAAKTGINEHALPGVGEGLVIRSTDTQALLQTPNVAPPQINPGADNSPRKSKRLRQTYSQSLRDLQAAQAIGTAVRTHANATSQRMMRTWGEHYAGVVARDGGDYVTLENYNRRTEIRWEHQRIFNNLFEDFAEFRTLVSRRLEHLNATPDAPAIRQLVQLAAQAPHLQHAYQQALQEAAASFQTGLQLNQATSTANFYFAMYGPGAQSFHAAFAPLTSNAMTLRVRETLDPVRQEATIGVQNLGNFVQQLTGIIQAHPIAYGGVNGVLQGDLNQARLAHQQAGVALAAAQNRGQYQRVDRAATQAHITLQTNLRQHLIASYQTITGNAPHPHPNDLNDLLARTTAYVNSYYRIQRIGSRYGAITALQAVLPNLIAANL